MKKITLIDVLKSGVKITAICILFLCAVNLNAQDIVVYELDQGQDSQINKSTTKAKSGLMKKSTSNSEKFLKIVKKNEPAVYLNNNTISKVSENFEPNRLKANNVQSLEVLKRSNKLFNKVELITVNLKNEKELNTPIDLSSFKGVNKLKYIYVKCYFKCTSNQIKTFVLNANPKISIFYSMVDQS